MKKLNLLLCATTILSCASIFCMQNADKIVGIKTGIAAKQYDVVKPGEMLAMRDAFIERYGVPARELVHALKVRANLMQKYVEYAKKKMDKFKDVTDPVERRSLMANAIMRKYIKTGDLYEGIAKTDKRHHYKNYKKEILIILPRMGLNSEYISKYIKFPKYGYTGKKHKAAKKEEVKPVATNPVKEFIPAPPRPRPVRPSKRPVFVKETEVDIWEVQPPKRPMVKPAMVAQNGEFGVYLPAPRPEPVPGDYRPGQDPRERGPVMPQSVMVADDFPEGPDYSQIKEVAEQGDPEVTSPAGTPEAYMVADGDDESTSPAGTPEADMVADGDEEVTSPAGTPEAGMVADGDEEVTSPAGTPEAGMVADGDLDDDSEGKD